MVNVFGTVVSAMLVGMWIFVAVLTVRGVITKEVLWKGAGEDREEGGFKRTEGLIERKPGPHEAA